MKLVLFILAAIAMAALGAIYEHPEQKLTLAKIVSGLLLLACITGLAFIV